jgi:hypothetical protein
MENEDYQFQQEAQINSDMGTHPCMDTRQFHASLGSYVVFGIMFGSVIIFGVFLVVNGHHAAWKMVMIFGGVLAFTSLWLARFKLTITAESVTYRSLFGGTRSVSRSDIVTVQHATQTSSLESPFTVVVVTRDGVSLRINGKVFPLEAARKLFGLVEQAKS